MKKISTMLLNQRSIRMRLHVNLEIKDKDKYSSYHTEFTYNNAGQIKLDSRPFITLEMVQGKDEVWSKNKSIMLFNSNIFTLIRAMEKIKKAIYGDDIFYLKSNKSLSIYTDMADEVSEVVNMGINQKILIRPTIIYDDNDIALEGVLICFQTTDNSIHLSIDEFEELLFVLNKIDIFQYAQLLLNYYVGYMSGNGAAIKPKTNTVKNTPRRNVFDNVNNEKTVATGNIKKENPFEGLE